MCRVRRVYWVYRLLTGFKEAGPWRHVSDVPLTRFQGLGLRVEGLGLGARSSEGFSRASPEANLHGIRRSWS